MSLGSRRGGVHVRASSQQRPSSAMDGSIAINKANLFSQIHHFALSCARTAEHTGTQLLIPTRDQRVAQNTHARAAVAAHTHMRSRCRVCARAFFRHGLHECASEHLITSTTRTVAPASPRRLCATHPDFGRRRCTGGGDPVGSHLSSSSMPSATASSRASARVSARASCVRTDPT